MPAVVSSEYYSGQGILSVGTYNADIDNIGFRDMGNVTSLTLQTELEKFEHRESTTGDRGIDLTLNTTRKTTMQFVMENVEVENMNVALQAVSAETSATLAEVVTRPARLGLNSYLGGLNVTVSAVVDNLTGNTVYELNIHYQVDLAHGKIYWMTLAEQTAAGAGTGIIAAAIAESDDIRITLDIPAHTDVHALKDVDKIVTFRFAGLNTAKSKEPVNVVVFKATIDPLQTMEMINTELQQITINANVLYYAEAAFGTSNYYRVTKLTPS